MVPPPFVIPAAGTLPGFRFDRRGRLRPVGDARRAPTGFFNSFSPLQHEGLVVDDAGGDEVMVAAADVSHGVVPEASAAAPGVVPAASAVGALGDVAAAASASGGPGCIAAAAADASRWRAAPWIAVAALWVLVLFSLLPVAGGSRLF